jgi:ABC-type microcin C transport system permease subunit YejB
LRNRWTAREGVTVLITKHIASVSLWTSCISFRISLPTWCIKKWVPHISSHFVVRASVVRGVAVIPGFLRIHPWKMTAALSWGLFPPLATKAKARVAACWI